MGQELCLKGGRDRAPSIHEQPFHDGLSPLSFLLTLLLVRCLVTVTKITNIPPHL